LAFLDRFAFRAWVCETFFTVPLVTLGTKSGSTGSAWAKGEAAITGAGGSSSSLSIKEQVKKKQDERRNNYKKER
jgi:hypothetical protein